MLRSRGMAALFGALALGACAAPLPAGPSVMALPAKDKSFADFQQDDATCRQYAAAQIGYVAPAQAANQSFGASAATGTLLGAAAGAAIGAAAGNPALGAAIGGGSGLLFGSAAGANAAGYSGAALQRSYDMSYVQCMSAKGESVPTSLGAAGPYPYAYPYSYPYAYYPYGPYAYAPYPYFYPPVFVGGTFVFGGGHRFHRH